MSTGIQWTDDTWNPVTGCTKVSPGCAHCYAETVALRLWTKQYPWIDERPVKLVARPRQFTDVQCHPDRLDQPLRWRRPRRVFVNSMSDLFHETVADTFIDRVFAVMALAPQHTFQVLTKRADRMRKYLLRRTFGEAESEAFYDACADIQADGADRAMDQDWPLPNVWLGVSVENQHFADERIPLLLQTPAAVRFVSAEPLLEDVTIFSINGPIDLRDGQKSPLDWVIVGGESGPKSRDCAVDWVRSILWQCREAHVPCFVKQLGRQPFVADGVYLNLRNKKGGDISEFPEDLRVREYPEARL